MSQVGRITTSEKPTVSFWKGSVALFGLGLTGVVAIGLLAASQLSNASGAPDLPPAVLAGLSALTPTLLLLVAAAAGALTAPRLGLRSHVYAKAADGSPVFAALRPQLPLALLLGFGLGVLLIGLDLLFTPFVEGTLVRQQEELGGAANLLVRMLYGGITEEILLRWGLMSLVAWLLWRLFQRRGGAPNPSLVWAAVAVSALLFGLGHLPAAAATEQVTAAVLLRILLLNGIPALVFGWLYWRRSLEAAMVSHATIHVVFSLAAWTGILGWLA